MTTKAYNMRQDERKERAFMAFTRALDSNEMNDGFNELEYPSETPETSETSEPVYGGEGVSSEVIPANISRTSEVSEVIEVNEVLKELRLYAKSSFSEKTPEIVRDESVFPGIVRDLLSLGNTPREKDVLLLSALTVISSSIPFVSGLYNKKVYANLYLMILANAAAGKGIVELSRYLVDPIDEMREKESADAIAKYTAELTGNAIQDAAKKKPKMKMHHIPAGSSSAAFIMALADNPEGLLLFETECDSLSNAWKSEYGAYSDLLRKSFHHERVSSLKKTDRELLVALSPRLSTLLTGTPGQLKPLIPSAENGLFSRFCYYMMSSTLEWNVDFRGINGQSKDVYIQRIGRDLFSWHERNIGNKWRFDLTDQQIEVFNTLFNELQQHYYNEEGSDAIAVVRRMGLIVYRIAMILSTLRLYPDEIHDNVTVICSNEDMWTAIRIGLSLLRHSFYALNIIGKTTDNMPVEQGASGYFKTKLFLQDLPDNFTTKDFHNIADKLGIPRSSAERRISTFVKEEKIVRVSQGNYRKHTRDITKSPDGAIPAEKEMSE